MKIIFLLLITFSCAAYAQEKVSDTVHLKSIEVKASKAPFSIRHDTLVFDATLFKLSPNAVVSDLLKKLPGVVIDKDGNITVNGKTVNKIQVDGRNFFGDNKDATTKYLPADIIDKVEVAPTKTIAQQRSLSVKPPSEDVTINLTLKKNKNTGIIANMTAGAGTRDRYNVDGMINSFQQPTRISVMGAVSNVDGGSGARVIMAGPGSGGGGGGLSTRQTGSINLNMGRSSDLSYSYNGITNTSEQQTSRLNLIPGNSFTNNSNNRTQNRSDQHQLYAGITYEKDTLTVWNFRPSFGIGKINNATTINEISTTADGKVLNTLSSQMDTHGNNLNIGSDLSFNKTSRNKKVNLNTSWRFGLNNKDEDQHNFSVISQHDSSNQYVHVRENNLNNNFTFNLSADIGKGFVAALDYTLDAVYNDQLRDVRNDSTLSGSSKSYSFAHAPSLQFAWKNDRMSIALNSGMRFTQQQNRLKDSVINIHQQQFSPNLQFNYNFSKSGHLFAGYSVSSSAPSAEQLSSVEDNSNPLFIKKGNPGLKSSFTQNIFTNVFYYNPVNAISLNAMGNASFFRNQIVSDQYYDSIGRQTSTYQNVSGAWMFNVSGNFSIRKQLNNWTISTNIGIGEGRTNNIGFVLRQKNVSVEWKSRANIYCSIDFKKLFTLSPSYNIELNKTNYSLPGIDDITYTAKSVRLDWLLTPVKRVEISGDMNYTNNSRLPEVFICNSAAACKFLKKEQLVLKFSVNDIFNNNRNISRTATTTYIETKQVNALQRYMMISLQFFFGQMSGGRGVVSQAIAL
ncbi:Outer membrane receptor proteins, mostly Fe transport [Chitinophaga sp. YR573]|uniref:outer membrane beta-barrel protein n=1 Tax=Chitinophaga sp. YR573 TaxID=1881040 RepID=UPI0008D23A52|nr:outer membrane beta-barrel protein [Chitinophaga sp. YR573]SEW01324.1 Outer membrane receptor proteins, mostly Fe transport [Chitinophaga sp. YR573]